MSDVNARCCNGQFPPKRKKAGYEHQYRDLHIRPVNRLLAGQCKYIRVRGSEHAMHAFRTNATNMVRRANKRARTYTAVNGDLIVMLREDQP
jgi:hypothetical protein